MNRPGIKQFIHNAFFYRLGVILRDSHGVAQVRFVTGNKVLRILKKKGLAPELPEDLYFLIKKAVAIRKHLERNRKDRDAKFRLILVESRIHRLARYYKTKRVLPPTWKYESGTASALVAWKKIYHFQVVYVSCLLPKLTEYIRSTSHVSSIYVLLLVGFL